MPTVLSGRALAVTATATALLATALGTHTATAETAATTAATLTDKVLVIGIDGRSWTASRPPTPPTCRA
ncbi:hypothetical protein AB0C90_05815 [Streptomyces sp. NPDC048550]|uniref:hypothetical protein n=1 Tax=Streptomyces sp. NPDC048550 TaxID=3155739 RepID=UPI00343799F5